MNSILLKMIKYKNYYLSFCLINLFYFQYPDWLADNRSSLSEEDFDRYNKQYDLMKQVSSFSADLLYLLYCISILLNFTHEHTRVHTTDFVFIHSCSNNLM